MLAEVGFVHVEVNDSGRESGRLRQGREPVGNLLTSRTRTSDGRSRLRPVLPLGAEFHERLKDLLSRHDVNDYATSPG